MFNEINFYQDGKGRSVLNKLDDLFNLHSDYTSNYNDNYQLLNTSLHDSTHLCLYEQLNYLNSELNELKNCLVSKKNEINKDMKRNTRGIKVDTKLEDFYNGYINNLLSFEKDILYTKEKLIENLPINTKFESNQLKVNLDKDQMVYNSLVSEYHLKKNSNLTNRIERISNFKEISDVSSLCATLATVLMKFANDIRFLSSGPRSGFGEMTIPENEPGSSIMPGKVNPTQCESLTMICSQVLGNNNAVLIANSSNMFEGANFLPLISNNTVRSVVILTDGMKSFRTKCMIGASFIDNSANMI